jgi:hypothetical protein
MTLRHDGDDDWNAVTLDEGQRRLLPPPDACGGDASLEWRRGTS